jgi:hypothetical protein
LPKKLAPLIDITNTRRTHGAKGFR